MAQIFISYSSADMAFATRLAQAFNGEGWSVWWDREIPPGMDYAKVIETAIGEAACVVVLWSRESIQSRWVHTEAAAAADRQIIITAIIDDTDVDALPFEFKRLQAVSLHDWRPGRPHDGYGRVVSRIRALLDEPAPVSPEDSRAGAATTWIEALTHWGRGAQVAWRGAAVVAWLAAVTAVVHGSSLGVPAATGVAAALTALGFGLLALGRRPA
jgi:hypothetical protein